MLCCAFLSFKKRILGSIFRIIDFLGINIDLKVLCEFSLEGLILKTNAKHEIFRIHVYKLIPRELLIQLQNAKALIANSIVQELADDHRGVEDGQQGQQPADVRGEVLLVRDQQEGRGLVEVQFTQKLF